MCVDINTQNIINARLRSLPHLSRIIHPCDSQTRLHFDQYGGNILSGRELEIEESTIYEVLLGAQVFTDLKLKSNDLKNCCQDIRKFVYRNLVVNWSISRYSESEVFDALTLAGYTPIIDPRIIPERDDSKKADFKIPIDEPMFLSS